MLSFLVYHNFSQPVKGLDKFPEEDRPPVFIPFQSYHLMIMLGMAFIAASLLGLVLLKFNRLFEQRWLMWLYVFAVLGAYAANESGWVAAEVGRQPWVVYGLLRTKDGVSHSVTSDQVLTSMIMFAIVYSFLFVVWVMVMNARIVAGPPLLEDLAKEDAKVDAESKKGARQFWSMLGQLLERGPASLSETWRGPAPTMSGQSEIAETKVADKQASADDDLDQENSQEAKP